VLAAQANRAAYAAIYERYGGRVYAYVRTRVESDSDAVDVTQQVFVKGMQGLAGLRLTEAPLLAWLFRIARNTVVDHHRRKRYHHSLDAAPLNIEGSDPDPESEAMTGEESARLRLALSLLPADRRELLALRYAGGLKVREIADATGLKEHVVKKRLTRSLQKLRQELEADDHS
jgi:RNA polymerase sigma factor (sigma-70 family)